MFTLNTAHEIWLKLQELHNGTTNVCEQKHCLAKTNYDYFTMNDDELCRCFEQTPASKFVIDAR